MEQRRAAIGGSGSADEETIGGLAPPEVLSVPPQLGRYAVLETVGAGAMGRVLRAYDPVLRREVALKLVKTPGERATARILREAQAMAQLSHPNVVPVYDVGAHGGEVFVAMELIEGMTLKQWLEQPHPWTEVVDVMIEAGRGLAAAHAVGLIHRDFKPSNVLIGADRVRVVDFGLARAARGGAASLDGAPVVDRSGDDVSLDKTLTEAGTIVGTPSYLAPEQHQGRPADERSDQFSFCTALYEALVGERPFVAKDVRGLAQAKRRGPPPIPPRAMPRHVAAVVVRGLDPEPSKRFAAMNELLAALGRDPSRTRRRALLGGAVVLGVVGAVAAVGTVGGESPCAGAAEQLASVWNDQRRETVGAAFAATELPYADDAWRTASADLQHYADAWIEAHTEACAATRIRGEQSDELLDARIRCLSDRKQVLAAHVDTFAEADASTVQEAVKAIAGLPDIERCADAAYVMAAVPPPDDPERAAAVRGVRELLAEVKARGAAGRNEESLSRAREALLRAEEVAYEPAVAEAHFSMGFALARVAEYEAAAEHLESAFFIGRRSGMDELAASAAAELVFTVGIFLDDEDGAAAWEEHARVEVERFGTDILRASLLDKRAALLGKAGEGEAALALMDEALALKQRLLPPEHPFLAGAWNNRGNVFTGMGRLDEAIEAYAESLRIFEAVHGPHHPAVGAALSNLANAYSMTGRPDEAYPYLTRALQVREAALGRDHPEYAVTLAAAGHLYTQQGDRAKGLATLREAEAVFLRSLGPEHHYTRSVQAEIAAMEALPEP